VPRVDKIVGPGNIYVATAKKMVFGDVDIDSEAGPTEVLAIADRSATPLARADLISQAEHDELAQAILITPVKSLVARVQEQIAKQLKTLERAKIARKSLSARGAIIVAKDIAECVALAKPVRARAPRDREQRRRPDRQGRAERGRDLPRALHAAWRSATISPARTTCCPRAARRASSRRSAWTTS
jgi:hypothetical protein